MKIEKGKVIRITVNDKLEVLEIPWTLEGHENAIGADMCEVVRTLPGYDPIVMLVDESGLLKHKPINKAASIMYGSERHGRCIAGDVILVELEGPETVPLNNLDFIEYSLLNMFPFLEKAEK